jgi:hypothetical protein
VSWGQRIFRISSPAYFERHNGQREISIHNLRLIDFVVPGWFISSYFFPALLVYGAFEFSSWPYAGSFMIWRDQEPAELLLSLGFLALTIAKLIQLRNRRSGESC